MGKWLRVTEEEKQEMLSELAAGTEVLLRALDGVSDDEARHAPAPDRWSVLACVEHVAVVEEYLLARVLESVDAAEPFANAARESRIRRFAPNRSRRIAAPEMVIPQGRFATLAEAIRAYQDSRAKTTRFVESSTGDLRAKVATHPLFGPVSCYEMLLMMAAHPRRHAEQIGEVRRTSPGSAQSLSC